MRFAMGLLVFALLLPGMTDAQESPVSVGARVRVTAPSFGLVRHSTQVTAIHADSMVVNARGSSRTIAFADATALEVSMGKRRMPLEGALIGFGAGALTGLVLGLTTNDESDSGWFAVSDSEAGLMAGVALGAGGLISGAIVGLFLQTDRWSDARTPIKAAVRPTKSGGVGLTFSRAF